MSVLNHSRYIVSVFHCVAAGVSFISTGTPQQEGPEFVFSV